MANKDKHGKPKKRAATKTLKEKRRAKHAKREAKTHTTHVESD